MSWNGPMNPPTILRRLSSWERDGYALRVDNGKALAEIRPEVYYRELNMRDCISAEIEGVFLGAQLMRRQPFVIRGGAINKVWESGRRDVTIVAESADLKITGYKADLVYTDKDGVVHDTRKDRIERTERFAKLAAKFRDLDVTTARILTIDTCINNVLFKT